MERDLGRDRRRARAARPTPPLARAPRQRQARDRGAAVGRGAPASTSTTTSSAAAAAPTRSRRRSGRCGPGWRRPRRRARVRDNLPLFERPGGDRHQHARHRQPVGRAVRLGAAAAVRRRGAAPLRLRRRRRPHRARLPVDAGRGLRAPRHAGREVRRRAPHLRRRGRARGSATPATRSASAGPTASRWSCSATCIRHPSPGRGPALQCHRGSAARMT